MKKVLAIVYHSPAHLDFGGNGYLDTLRQELSEGAEVDLIVSEKPTTKGNVINVNTLPIQVLNKDKKIYLSGNYEFSSDVIDSIEWLNGIITSKKYDKIYIDRLCSYAQISMHACKISNYCAVGTASMTWGYKKSVSYGKRVLMPCRKKNSNLVLASNYFNLPMKEFNFSHWVYSDNEALHFLPTIWYQPNRKLSYEVPSSNNDSLKKFEEKIRLLVTYGNSMPLETVKLLITKIRELKITNPHIEIKVLTGTVEFYDLTVTLLGALNIKIEKWGNYEEEFTRADYVIGHGGTSHIFNCIEYQAIPICIPALADQFYNAERAIALNIGYSLFEYKWWRNPFRYFDNVSRISSKVINGLLTNKHQYLKKTLALRALKANE